jgi:hypothetical protein
MGYAIKPIAELNTIDYTNLKGNADTVRGSSLRIGTGYPTYSKEKVAVFQAYNRDLSTTEVTNNFNATKSRFGL